MSRRSILIFLADPLAAALVGAAAELSGHATCYPATGESVRGALRRTRAHIVILDCDDEEGCSDAVVGPAIMTGARVLVVRTPRTRRRELDLMEHQAVTVVDLPGDADLLMAAFVGDD